MIKLTSTYTFLLLSSFAFGQIYTPDTNAYKSFIKIDFEASFENNALDNEFTKLFFSDEFIPRDVRERNANGLRVQNNFGIDIIQTNEAYLGMLDPFEKRYGLKVGFDMRYSMYANYNRDLMELVFLGNSGFENTPATVHSTSINELFYQRLTFGIYDELSTSYLNLAIGKGSSYRKIEFDKGSVFMGENGQYIDLDWEGDYSETPSSKFGDWNGTSVSADFKWNILSKPTKSRNFLNILWLEASHIGFMRWNDVVETQVDTTFTFEGLELGNFLDDSFTFPTQSALEDSIIPNSQNTKRTQFLPFHVGLGASSLRASGLSYGFEFDHWVNNKAFPNFRFLLGYLVKNNFKVNTEYSIGGYQRSKFGLSFEYEINYSWYWKLGTHHFIDNFNKKGLGRSIFVTLKRDIR